MIRIHGITWKVIIPRLLNRLSIFMENITKKIEFGSMLIKILITMTVLCIGLNGGQKIDKEQEQEEEKNVQKFKSENSKKIQTINQKELQQNNLLDTQ